MKRILCFLLCVIVLCGISAIPASAEMFQVTYYSEEIYAGGIVDLYAFANSGGVEPFTYQWQAEGFGWIDLVDNEHYKGTKTNHLQVYTSPGDYSGWETLPFQCAITDAEGTTLYTPSIFMHIYPTANLIPNMKNWGYGLYEPTLTNVTALQTSDYVNYKASTFAGSKINILCGSTPVENRAVLSNSEVALTRQIHITENGHTTQVGDQTTYIPYTIGANAVTVEIKLHLTIGNHDLGDLDTKTIKLDVQKPNAVSKATANTACSLLRYTYNESQKLASIPKGTTVEVLAKEGSYYQVLYNNLVGYVGTSLLNTQTPSYDPVIKDVDVQITEPVAGEKPTFTCSVPTQGCQLYKTDPISWADKQTGKFLGANETFQEGHSYNLTIWLSAKDGYKFQVDAAGKPKLTAAINGNLPPYIYKAYEQDPEEVIELSYDFNNVKAKKPEQTHTCTPVLVERVAPTCTQAGREAYYYCSCGMHYKDSKGQTAVDLSAWGKIPATGHTPSGWRNTQIAHYKACTSCGDFLQEQDHTGGTATCIKKAVCTVCGNSYGDLSDHRWSPTYLYQDSTGHAWICADCKSNSKVEAHKPGPAATKTDPQICTECGYIITPAKNHTHKLKKVPQTPATCMQEGNIEYYTCDGCSDRFADAAGKTKLPANKSVAVGALGHTASQTWSTNAEYHWRSCTICKDVLEEIRMLHEMREGKCTTCAYVAGSGNVTPEETNPTETAASQQDTTSHADATVSTETTSGTEAAPSDDALTGQSPAPEKERSTNWAMAVMISLVCFGASVTATVIVLKKKKK